MHRLFCLHFPFVACLCITLMISAPTKAATDVTINVTGSITPGTCLVSDVSMLIGDVGANEFPNIGDESSTSAESSLRLSCQGSPKVTLEVSGVDSPNQQYPYLFGIETGPHAANGIAVKLTLTNGNQTIGQKTPITLTNSAASALEIPISARYVRTGAITAGLANANMRATFSYE